MATAGATRFLRSFPARHGMQQSWFQSLIQARRSYYTGDRYQGYVSFFQPDELFGFVVREDLPDKEYYFHSTDLHCRNVPRVRPLQQVEFSIVEGRGGNYIGRDITGPNSSDLEFNHPNMRLSTHERGQFLSQLPNAMHERHKGVVVTVHADGQGGLIVPDRMNFQVVAFRMHEVQSTGYEKLDRFSEVEFFVRPGRYENARDRAICLTRPGGGLITGERKEVGQRRRTLGAMYGPSDTKARFVPPEFQTNRQRGVVVDFQSDKLFGFIASLDAPGTTACFVHCDDCHIAGKRTLRKGQFVEFSPVTDKETQRTKALHVTGEGQTVLNSMSHNYYLPRDLCTMEFAPDGVTRHRGTVLSVDRARGAWFLIKPNERGYQPIFAVARSLNTLGRKTVDVGTAVEFAVTEQERPPRQDEEGDEAAPAAPAEPEMRLIATSVTAEGNVPLLTQRGLYGRYLQSKINLPIFQTDLPPAPVSEGATVQGYISSFARRRGTGTIEVEAPDGERYQKAVFQLADCVLPENIEVDKVFFLAGAPIKCNIAERSEPLNDEEQEMLNGGGSLLSRVASNITTVDMDYLQCREFREDFGDEAKEHDDTDLRQELRSSSSAQSEDSAWDAPQEKKIAL